MIKNRVVALGLFLFAVFFLSASGHTYSPDEESLLYVTKAFVTRGEFDIPSPEDYPVTGGSYGTNGKLYAGSGMAQSLMVLPLYVIADRFADTFDSHFHAYILRLVVVSFFNSLLGAATGMLLYAWSKRLGVSTRVALALVLLWAFGTLTWVYVRTFFTETLIALAFVLAAYAVHGYHVSRALHWMIVAGLAVALGMLSKVQGVLILPALALYFTALEFRRNVWEFIRYSFLPGALFTTMFGIGLGLFGYFNFARFGNPLETGHAETWQVLPDLTRLYGLLFSPGKSVFLYAPPIVLFFFAFARFYKTRRAEALACLVLVVTLITFHAGFDIWSGDGAWGPRYLDVTMAFFILPISAIATGWWRSGLRRLALVGLCLAGLVVALLGLAINFDTYIQIEANENIRHFRPDASPLLWQSNLLHDRIGAWWNSVVMSQNAVVPLRGFLATGSDDILPRYVAPRASLLVKSNLEAPLQMSLLAYDYRPANQDKRRLAFLANGSPLNADLIPNQDSGILAYRVEIPLPTARRAVVDIITSGSKPVGTSPQGDELGVHLQSLRVSANGQELLLPDYLAISPLPTHDPKAQWAWFYEPGQAQFDFFWWYLYFSGLPDAQVLALDSTFVLLGILCCLAGAPTVWRVLMPPRPKNKPQHSRVLRLGFGTGGPQGLS